MLSAPAAPESEVLPELVKETFPVELYDVSDEPDEAFPDSLLSLASAFLLEESEDDLLFPSDPASEEDDLLSPSAPASEEVDLLSPSAPASEEVDLLSTSAFDSEEDDEVLSSSEDDVASDVDYSSFSEFGSDGASSSTSSDSSSKSRSSFFFSSSSSSPSSSQSTKHSFSSSSSDMVSALGNSLRTISLNASFNYSSGESTTGGGAGGAM